MCKKNTVQTELWFTLKNVLLNPFHPCNEILLVKKVSFLNNSLTTASNNSGFSAKNVNIYVNVHYGSM